MNCQIFAQHTKLERAETRNRTRDSRKPTTPTSARGFIFFPVDFDPRLEDDVQLHVDNDDYDDDNNDDDWNYDDDDDNDVWNDGNDQDNSSAIWFIC